MGKQVIGFDPDANDSSPKFELGTIHEDEQGRQYVYAQAHATTTAGYFYILPDAGTYHVVALTTSATGTPGTNWKNICVACAAITTDYYGWFWIGPGFFECVIEDSFAAADVIYTTANAGLPGTNSSSHILDGFKTIDAGASATRVTCFAAGRLTAGKIACHD